VTRAHALGKKHDVRVELAVTMLETRTANGFYIATGQPVADAESTAAEKEPQNAEMQTVIRHVHEYNLPEVAQTEPSKPLPEAPAKDFSLPNGQKPSSRVRAMLVNTRKQYGMIKQLVTSISDMPDRRKRLAESDPLKWVEQETRTRANHEN